MSQQSSNSDLCQGTEITTTGQTWVYLKGTTCSAGGGITAQGVVQHPYRALKPPCKGAALPLLSRASRLLFAGVLRKSTVAIATAGSVARVASRGTSGDRVPSNSGAGLSTLITAEALPALTPRALQTVRPSRRGCTQLVRFLPSVVDVAKFWVLAWS